MAERRWVVTGGLGFIGSAFVRLVLRERPDVAVTVLDAMTYAANPANVGDVARLPRYRFVRGDIADPAAVDAAVGKGAEALVNFAAETHVDRSILDPAVFLRTDVVGTGVLLDAVRRGAVARFVQVSTDEVYGDIAQGASREDDPVRPNSPYAAAKASADLLALAYRTTYGVPVRITRGANTYGPYQFPEKLIPLFLTNLLEGRDVPVYGDGLQVRDWLHVDDHARGVLTVLEAGEDGAVYNLGAGNSRPNLEIVRRLLELTGCGEERIHRVVDRPGHDRRYALDSSRAHALGWRPEIPLERGLAETADWYRRRADWWRPLKDEAFWAYYGRRYA